MEHQIVIAGFGGQGVMSMGQLMTYAGMVEDKQVSYLPSYGPEMRGGTANCNVIISDQPVGSPVITEATCLMALNRPSLEKYESMVVPGGIVIVNSSLIDIPCSREDVDCYYIPANEMALEMGNTRVANIIMLGAYLKLTDAVHPEDVLKALPKVLGESKAKLIPINREALARGAKFIEEGK